MSDDEVKETSPEQESEIAVVEHQYDIPVHSLHLEGGVELASLHQPAQAPIQPQGVFEIGYRGYLTPENINKESKLLDKVNLYTNLTVNAGPDVQKAKLTYFGVGVADKNAKGQIFSGGAGLTFSVAHLKNPFADTSAIDLIAEGDNVAKTEGKVCPKYYEFDTDNRWSVGVGAEVYANQKISDFLEIEEKAAFEYVQNSGLNGSTTTFNGRNINKSPEDYFNSKVAEIPGLKTATYSPFQTLFETRVTCKPIRNFTNFGIYGKVGVGLDGAKAYPCCAVGTCLSLW